MLLLAKNQICLVIDEIYGNLQRPAGNIIGLLEFKYGTCSMLRERNLAGRFGVVALPLVIARSATALKSSDPLLVTWVSPLPSLLRLFGPGTTNHSLLVLDKPFQCPNYRLNSIKVPRDAYRSHYTQHTSQIRQKNCKSGILHKSQVRHEKHEIPQIHRPAGFGAAYRPSMPSKILPSLSRDTAQPSKLPQLVISG